ncbi:hypothetical protein PVAP13_6KG020700 [Panicum virgatum]|uniref:Uncharacterized protein n=1 Tax=Panicum virgatum TaxID=38727 RepID=A0A8T0R6S8_PANVG|nr:hypothetical protein PVAP13_6KG020700 [Panicum virgatum]
MLTLLTSSVPAPGSQVQSPRCFSNFLVHWVQVCGSWLTTLPRCHVQTASSKESAQDHAMYCMQAFRRSPTLQDILRKIQALIKGNKSWKKKRRKEVVSCCVGLTHLLSLNFMGRNVSAF